MRREFYLCYIQGYRFDNFNIVSLVSSVVRHNFLVQTFAESETMTTYLSLGSLDFNICSHLFVREYFKSRLCGNETQLL